MDIGVAIICLTAGDLVRRRSWEKSEFIFLVKGSKFNVSREPLISIFPEGTEINYNPHIDIKNEDGTIGMWNPSQLDLLAEDWEIVK